MLNTAEFAEHFKVAYTTVMTWLARNIIPGARRVPTPRGDVWEIPLSALETFKPPKPGRPPKSISGREQPDESSPAKPKRRVSNRTDAKKVLKKKAAKKGGAVK